MPITITKEREGVLDDVRYVFGHFLADSSWLTAGEPVAASDFGWDHISFISIEEQGGIVFHWDRAAQTILAYRTGSGNNVVLSFVATGQNISTVATSVEFFAIGY